MAVVAVVVDAVVVDAVVVDAVVVVEVDLFNSPGAFKIVIFAGSNSGSPFGFGAVALGCGCDDARPQFNRWNLY